MPEPAPPLIVVWRVTAHCDLGCQFCGYSRELRRPRAQMSAEAARAFGAVLSAFAAEAGRVVQVSWLGGEPLLWPPLRSVGQTFRELNLQLGVTTNATHLSEAWCEHLAAHYAQVTVSVDGLQAWHDQVRGAAGLFEQVRAGVARLTAARARGGAALRLRVNTILMRSNVRGLDALCAALADWGVDEVTFNALGGLDRGGAFYERERLRPEDVAWLRAGLPALRAAWAARGLTVRGADGYLARLAATASGERLPVEDCGPGQAFLFIDEYGRAGPCNFILAEHGQPLSGLSTAEALRQLPAQWTQALRQRRPAACADCHSTQVFGKFL